MDEIEEEYREIMLQLAHQLAHVFNDPGLERETGYVLLVFPLKDPTVCNYVSNLHKSVVMQLLKDQVQQFEQSYHG